ncbi:hypothetical protein DO97_04540 [Neosynechococcus sphagnicola sy1]|uniref:RND efflux pump membrane fusion protein barrel-sandwich domain-containing protein n=1 Tax=Neosynechococcus sphagnicola sy1 TaxID=1497020 RepID=A0A098TQ50_9CYAN|nr:HlyD family efflux transporter periplasmic adaptor subunit [Neosynechococcus sphagnicola]KGF72953.1 hypothetical protein DO97_04540 [Neosynechococcus sphagnicola sy1]
MRQMLYNKFREDLVITKTIQKDGHTPLYLVKDPLTNEVFEFGEEEYFLCEAIDGKSSQSGISKEFYRRFNLSLSEEDLINFFDQINSFGLLTSSENNHVISPSISNNTHRSTFTNDHQIPPVESRLLESNNSSHKLAVSPEKLIAKKSNNLKWFLPNPHPFLSFALGILKPFRYGFIILAWSLVPCSLIAIYTFFNNKLLVSLSIQQYLAPLPWITLHLLNMAFVNMTSKFSQGVIVTYYGGEVKELGVKLAFGIMPRFYIDRQSVYKLKNRDQQLWAFATPIAVRMFLFSFGIFLWYSNFGAPTSLKVWALSLAYMGLLDFLFDSSPLWPSDGYGWIISYFRLSPTLIKQNRLVWDMMVSRRALPKQLSLWKKLQLQIFPLLMIISWGYLAFKVAHEMVKDITPGILSQGAVVVLVSIPFIITFRWWLNTAFRTVLEDRQSSIKSQSAQKNSEELVQFSAPDKRGGLASVMKLPGKEKLTNFLAKKWKTLLILAGITVLFLYPYQSRPGGVVELLPPTQQLIQAQWDGQISQVFFKGGDGVLIKAGTVIATMKALDLESKIQTTQEAIKAQQSDLAAKQSKLNKLLNTPRPEDVAIAQEQVANIKQQVEAARQMVEVTRAKFQTEKNKAIFSVREANRFKELYDQGATSLQVYENAESKAQTDQDNADEKQQKMLQDQQDVLVKQQALAESQANLAKVMAGPYPDEIEAARHETEAARAELQKLRQELKYYQEQEKQTTFLMPFTGYLDTPYLDQKIGSYLKKGETFAVAEDNRNIRGEINVPEYNIGEFDIGGSVEIKLLAYSDKPITGKVISIEPTASSSSTNSSTSSVTSTTSESPAITPERFVGVIIEIPNSKQLIKAGMSGYAKIEGRQMPLIIAFTRPIIRFVQVEIWSWLP